VFITRKIEKKGAERGQTARNLKREEEKGRKRANRTRTNKMRARRNQKRQSDQINDTRKDNMHTLRVISPDDGWNSGVAEERMTKVKERRGKQDNTNQKKIRLKRRQTEDAMKPSFTSAIACVPRIAFVRKEANKGSHRLQIREKEAKKTN
jgi:hypothetical protein